MPVLTPTRGCTTDVLHRNLAYADVTALSGLDLAAIKNDVESEEKQSGTSLPHRGRVHGIGPTTTHKAQIVESILHGKQLTEVARLHSHNLHNVERYYRGYNAVEIAAGFTDDAGLMALMTGIEHHVAVQYDALVEKYHPEKIRKTPGAGVSSVWYRTNAPIHVYLTNSRMAGLRCSRCLRGIMLQTLGQPQVDEGLRQDAALAGQRLDLVVHIGI